jgi:hypothetical protein
MSDRGKGKGERVNEMDCARDPPMTALSGLPL